jgi:hypothetical protein
MYSRCSFRTALSPQEALLRLSRIVGPPQSRWQAIEAGPARQLREPFVGIIDGERFRIRRVIDYRNNFLPVISGKIAPDRTGSRVDIVVKLKPAVAVAMILWLGAMSFAAAAAVWQSVQIGEVKGLAALLLPIFGFVLVAIAFVPEKRKALKLLAETFDAASLEDKHGR